MEPETRRVLHCIPNMLSGGTQRQLVYLAREQVRRGWEVDVALVHPGPILALLEDTGARIFRLSGRSNYDPGLLRQMVRLVRRIRPFVIQTWLPQMDVIGGLAARWTGFPWVLSERASTLAYPATAKNRFREFVTRGAQAIVSLSQGGDRYWKTRVGRKTTRHLVPNAIPREEIARSAPISRREIGVETSGNFVLYAGRLSAEKHVDTLVQALLEAGRRIDMMACLCGDGTLEEHTRALVANHGAADRIRVVGYVPDVWRWMKSAGVFVSLGTTEGNPNAVLEAIVCGCPLVLSDTPEHREIVQGDGALYVPFDSASEVADAIVRTLKNPGEARRRAQAALAGLKRWSIADVADQYERIYEMAAAAKDRN
jgi:glycosyltransferase involved in cell wall biosynthesis